MMPPNEQNFFVATQLVFSLANFIGVDLSFTWNGPYRVLRQFWRSLLLCVVCVVLCCSHYYAMCYFKRSVF